MNKLVKLLPVLALVMGAGFAMAFSGPQSGPEYGLDGSVWRNVTGLIPGPTTYECNEADEVCTRTAPNETAPMEKDGIFVYNGN